MGQHLLCFAAQHYGGKPAPSVRSHHDQVALLVLGSLEDGLPGMIVALPNVLELHARSFSEALNDREFFVRDLDGFVMDDRAQVFRNEATRYRTVQWHGHRHPDHLSLREFCESYAVANGALAKLGAV